MPRRPRLAAALSLALGAAVLSVPVGAVLPGPPVAGHLAPASAEPPSVTSGDITDHAGVLTPEQTEELRLALAALPVEHDIRLAVVFVDDFDGLSADEWVQRTFTLSYRRGGGGRALLAIAVDEHSYGYLERTILSTSRAEQLATEEVAPLVEEGRWADAAMAAARGHTVARSIGGPPLAPRLWALALAGFLLMAVVLVGLTLDRRRVAARIVQEQREETEGRLARASAELSELRAEEVAVDPVLSDRERHTHLAALGSIQSDLDVARQILAEVPTQISWRRNRLPVIREWGETVERAGDRIAQAGIEYELAREELAEVTTLAEGWGSVDEAQEEPAGLAPAADAPDRTAAVREGLAEDGPDEDRPDDRPDEDRLEEDRPDEEWPDEDAATGTAGGTAYVDPAPDEGAEPADRP